MLIKCNWSKLLESAISVTYSFSNLQNLISFHWLKSNECLWSQIISETYNTLSSSKPNSAKFYHSSTTSVYKIIIAYYSTMPTESVILEDLQLCLIQSILPQLWNSLLLLHFFTRKQNLCLISLFSQLQFNKPQKCHLWSKDIPCSSNSSIIWLKNPPDHRHKLQDWPQMFTRPNT